MAAKNGSTPSAPLASFGRTMGAFNAIFRTGLAARCATPGSAWHYIRVRTAGPDRR